MNLKRMVKVNVIQGKGCLVRSICYCVKCLPCKRSSEEQGFGCSVNDSSTALSQRSDSLRAGKICGELFA